MALTLSLVAPFVVPLRVKPGNLAVNPFCQPHSHVKKSPICSQKRRLIKRKVASKSDYLICNFSVEDDCGE